MQINLKGTLPAITLIATGCSSAPPLLFWDAGIPDSLLHSSRVFIESPHHANYLGQKVTKALHDGLIPCVPNVEVVPDEAAADASITIAEYPEMLGFDVPLARLEGAYLRVRFKNGGEGVLYRRAPQGCDDIPCIFDLIARDFAREWCRLKTGHS